MMNLLAVGMTHLLVAKSLVEHSPRRPLLPFPVMIGGHDLTRASMTLVEIRKAKKGSDQETSARACTAWTSTFALLPDLRLKPSC